MPFFGLYSVLHKKKLQGKQIFHTSFFLESEKKTSAENFAENKNGKFLQKYGKLEALYHSCMINVSSILQQQSLLQ